MNCLERGLPDAQENDAALIGEHLNAWSALPEFRSEAQRLLLRSYVNLWRRRVHEGR